MRARYLLLLAASFVGLTVACGDPTPQTTGDSPAGPVAPPSAEAVSLHERLFAAADKGDVDGFKATLTPESVEMLDRWFELQQRKLESNASWADFLKLHADLPARFVIKPDYYTADKLRCGSTVLIFGRYLLLVDCDEFTRQWYAHNLEVNQVRLPWRLLCRRRCVVCGVCVCRVLAHHLAAAVGLGLRCVVLCRHRYRRPHPRAMMPSIWYVAVVAACVGGSMMWCATVLTPCWQQELPKGKVIDLRPPTPPKLKMGENPMDKLNRTLSTDTRHLRALVRIQTDDPDQTIRRFILCYYIDDASISMFEPEVINTGHPGGKFLERGLYVGACAVCARGFHLHASIG